MPKNIWYSIFSFLSFSKSLSSRLDFFYRSLNQKPKTSRKSFNIILLVSVALTDFLNVENTPLLSILVIQIHIFQEKRLDFLHHSLNWQLLTKRKSFNFNISWFIFFASEIDGLMPTVIFFPTKSNIFFSKVLAGFHPSQ